MCNHVYLNNEGLEYNDFDNRGFEGRGFDRGHKGCSCNCNCNCNCGCNNGCGDSGYDDRAFEEAQRIINQVARRRGRENRCARQFVCCMRSINNNCNW